MTEFEAVGIFRKSIPSSFREERESVHDTGANGVMGSVKMRFRNPFGNLGFEHAVDSTGPILASLFGLGRRRAVEQPHQG